MVLTVLQVFFSSCNSVKFHSELLNYIDVEVMDIHGKQKQQKRTTTFFQFCKQKSGILLCTDVAARGLDIPAVDWIVQYDPPDDPKEYIHRVGRTARGTNNAGRALLFLLPEETAFLKYLRAAKVTLNEFEFPQSKIANVGAQMTMLVEKNYYLNKSAREAYRSYMLSYASHAHKEIFNVHELDLAGVGKAFGFAVPPRVDINLSARGDKTETRKKNRSSASSSAGAGVGAGSGSGENWKAKFGSSGHAFSADNPYGKRATDDKRQFSR
jgi:ATP-dependent RNA helicase DDX18/HAS1